MKLILVAADMGWEYPDICSHFRSNFPSENGDLWPAIKDTSISGEIRPYLIHISVIMIPPWELGESGASLKSSQRALHIEPRPLGAPNTSQLPGLRQKKKKTGDCLLGGEKTRPDNLCFFLSLRRLLNTWSLGEEAPFWCFWPISGR